MFLIVPSEAIVFNRDGLSVAVVENRIARIRAVNVVRDFGTTVEVSGGAAGSSKQLFEIELCHLLQVRDKWPG